MRTELGLNTVGQDLEKRRGGRGILNKGENMSKSSKAEAAIDI